MQKFNQIRAGGIAFEVEKRNAILVFPIKIHQARYILYDVLVFIVRN